jgi:hypothetical protein
MASLDTMKNVPRFMNPTASSLRHMTINPKDEDDSKIPTTLSPAKSNDALSKGIQKLRKAKTIINVFSAFKNSKRSNNSGSSNLMANTSANGGMSETDLTDKRRGKPATPYLAYADQQERMAKFMNNFEMSDMSLFLESITQLHQMYNDPKMIIERTKMCPVPRSYNTPFPMLKIVNGKTLSVGEYMLAENEEIFDICAHNNKKLGKKFVLDDSSNDGQKRKRLKFKMEFGNELKEKEFQSLKIEEAEDSDYETPRVGMNLDSFRSYDQEDFIVKKNRRHVQNKKEEEQFDANYLLDAITKSKTNIMALNDGNNNEFGGFVEDSNSYKTLQIPPGKWTAIQRRLPEPITINFGESIRRGFNKNRRHTDTILGIERTKKIEFRPFKTQILDMNYDEVIMKMKRAELKQNIEKWTETVSYLKSLELDVIPKDEDGNGSTGSSVNTPAIFRTSRGVYQEKKKPVFEEDAYLENDEVSKFFHEQSLMYDQHQKQKEKTEQLRQKSAFKHMSNKGIRRQLAHSGTSIVHNTDEDTIDDDPAEPIKFDKVFV